MTFSASLAGLAQAVFTHLGEAAVSPLFAPGAAALVVLDRPDVTAAAFEAQAVLPDASLQVAQAAVTRRPGQGDVFVIGAVAYVGLAPARDVEGDGAVWTLQVERTTLEALTDDDGETLLTDDPD